MPILEYHPEAFCLPLVEINRQNVMKSRQVAYIAMRSISIARKKAAIQTIFKTGRSQFCFSKFFSAVGFDWPLSLVQLFNCAFFDDAHRLISVSARFHFILTISFDECQTKRFWMGGGTAP